MASTKVMPCDCTSVLSVIAKQAGAKTEQCFRFEIPWFNRTNGVKFQDEQYGAGQRLHNDRSKAGKHLGWTCTCCGRAKLD